MAKVKIIKTFDTILKILFPQILLLHILQLEEYSSQRFLRWAVKHPFVRRLRQKKPFVSTRKAQIICAMSILYSALTAVLLTKFLGFRGLIYGFFLATQPYIFLVLANQTIKPLERLKRVIIKRKLKNKISRLKKDLGFKNTKTGKGLEVIGITGSYGKTSVKNFLYQLLSCKYSVLKTPESYNTLFGVAKVVNLELDNSYDFFICEMGAYKRGEIKELCQTFCPDHIILTGINEQHLERFGNIDNTIKAKFEILEFSNPKGIALLNGNNNLVLNNYQRYSRNVFFYGPKNSGFHIRPLRYTISGTDFNITLRGETYFATTPLIGESNLENILAASSMACLLGIKAQEIIEILPLLKPIPHRMEPRVLQNGSVIIDDAFSSNVSGFKNALAFLSVLEGKRKVLVTPGIVELGSKTLEAHVELGKLAQKVCDTIYLVGEGKAVEYLEQGISNQEKVKRISSLGEVDYTQKDTIFLLENDLPENYF